MSDRRNTLALARTLYALAAVLALGLAAPSTARADTLDEELLKKTREIFRYLHAKKATTVGVLKFRARRGTGPEGFHVSPLTSSLADRLEAFLVSSFRNKDVNVLRAASAVAVASKKPIDYRQASGRAALFDLKYPLYTQGAPVAADLFLTGTIQLDPTTTTVVLEAFGKDLAGLERVGVAITVDNDRSLLSEDGRSFVLSSRQMNLNNRKKVEEEANKDAQQRARQKQGEPWKDAERLVDLAMFLNKEPILFKPDPNNPGGTRFTCREPKKGDQIHFTLTNRSRQRLAVVLRVNGLNTLFAQIQEPALCSKWVLDPGDPPLLIEGFYTDSPGKDNLSEFSVLSEEQSGALALGNELQGTIEMVVFVEGPQTREKPRAKIAWRGLSRPAWEAARPRLATRQDVQTLVRGLMEKETKRGLIAVSKDRKAGSKLDIVEFKNPVQQQYLFLRYYPRKPAD